MPDSVAPLQTEFVCTGLAGVATIDCIADYVSIAGNRYYNMPHWMELAGLLTNYGITLPRAVSRAIYEVFPTLWFCCD